MIKFTRIGERKKNFKIEYVKLAPCLELFFLPITVFSEKKCKKMLARIKMWCYYKRTKHREME